MSRQLQITIAILLTLSFGGAAKAGTVRATSEVHGKDNNFSVTIDIGSNIHFAWADVLQIATRGQGFLGKIFTFTWWDLTIPKAALGSADAHEGRKSKSGGIHIKRSIYISGSKNGNDGGNGKAYGGSHNGNMSGNGNINVHGNTGSVYIETQTSTFTRSSK